jgi:flagellar hook-associated protein 3 FlgL
MIRTTFQSMTSGAQQRLMQQSAALERSQNRLSSGKQFTRTSEDPARASSALTLRSHLGSLETYKSAGEDATSRLNAADGTLGDVVDRVQRLKELAVTAANGTSGPGARNAIRTEVLQIRDELVGMANTRHLGQPLFAGFSSANAVASVAGAWQFTGASSEKIIRSVSDSDAVQVNVTASEVFQAGATDAFTMLDQLAADLASGNTTGIGAANAAIDNLRDSVSDARTRIGTATSRVEGVMNRNQTLQVSARNDLAQVEDIDFTEAITDVNRQQAAYQAALGATAKSIQQSLVDWLR